VLCVGGNLQPHHHRPVLVVRPRDLHARRRWGQLATPVTPAAASLAPLTALRSTAGAPLGAALAGWLFEKGVSPFPLMEIAAAILLVHLWLYRVVSHRLNSAFPRPAM